MSDLCIGIHDKFVKLRFLNHDLNSISMFCLVLSSMISLRPGNFFGDLYFLRYT